MTGRLLSVIVYSFARVSAVVGMRRQDYFLQGDSGVAADCTRRGTPPPFVKEVVVFFRSGMSVGGGHSEGRDSRWPMALAALGARLPRTVSQGASGTTCWPFTGPRRPSKRIWSLAFATSSTCVYVRPIWRLIMLAVRPLPERTFEPLNW